MNTVQFYGHIGQLANCNIIISKLYGDKYWTFISIFEYYTVRPKSCC